MTVPATITIGSVDLAAALTRWARRRAGPGARIEGLAPMPGNAGLSFGFTIRTATGDDPLVLRLAPPGVRRAGNTDVLRQVPLLGALDRAGIPIAPLVWHTGDESWFGTDAIVQRKLTAQPLHMSDGASGVVPGPAGSDPYLRQAMHVLADVHGVPWRESLGGWQAPEGVDDELDRWATVLARAGEPVWTTAGQRLERALRASAPDHPPVGLLHGDFQTNNILYDPDDGGLRAVIDWEIAGIGVQGLDVGWLAMMTDRSFWAPAWRERMRVLARPDDVRAWYEAARGVELERFDWYRALAAYRFGSIVAYNMRLHRTGRRVDPSYDLLAPSVTTLLARGLELAGNRS